jgi:hypothetical protein
MKTAVAPNVRPDRSESGEWPTLVPNLPGGAREAIEARWLDPTQGRKIGSDPYDAKSGLTPTTIPPRVKRSDLIPTTTRPEAGSTGRRHVEAVSLTDIAYPGGNRHAAASARFSAQLPTTE